MQKKLLTAAVSLALAAPAAAFAQATLYGVVDMSYINRDASSAGADLVNKSYIESGSLSGSRLGAKVSEDLGGGLSANAVIEIGLTADIANLDGATGGGLANRQSHVGLASKQWGELVLGRQYTHEHNELASPLVEHTGTGSVATMYSLATPVIRASNAVKYASPSFNGVSFGALWAPGEKAAAVSPEPSGGDDIIEFRISYDQGPLHAGFVYGKTDETAATPSSGETKRNSLTAGYSFGQFTVGGYYRTIKSSGTVAAPVNAKLWMLNASAKVGAAGTFVVQYLDRDDKTVANADTDGFGLLYMHGMSKRTTAYAAYGKVDLPGAVKDPRQVQVGLRHVF